MEKKLVYDIHDKPPFARLLVLALQQLLAILAATIAVPTIIGLPTQIPAAILGAGVGTLVYQLFTRFKSPVFLGSSFAFINSLFVAVSYGYCGIILGSIVAGLVYVVIAVIIHFTGTDWVNKLMPPVIIGPTVALIGLSLAGSAMGDIVKANADAVNGGYNLIGLLCGLITFFTVVICSTQKRYKMARLIPFIIGIAAGYAAAAIFTVIGNASIVTITTTAIMCIVLSFISPLMAILQTIPSCVMGGVCLTLYGFIAVSGLKMFKEVDLNENKNLFVVSAILISGIGGLSIQIPYVLAENGAVSAVITVTSIATALILGIITNAVLGKVEKSKLGKDPDETASEE